MGLSEKKGKSTRNILSKDINKGIHTFLDSIYQDIKNKGPISLRKIALKEKINVKEAEEWVKLLQRQGLVEVSYPPLGEISVRLINTEKEDNKKTTKTKERKLMEFFLKLFVAVIFIIAIVIFYLRGN